MNTIQEQIARAVQKAMDEALEKVLTSARYEAFIKREQAHGVRRVARLIYNGAGDPEQAFYDEGVAHWLERRADDIDSGGVS